MARKKKEEGPPLGQESISPEEKEETSDINNNLLAVGADEYSYTLRIPRDRVAALIGVKGRDKKELEDSSSARISVDSEEGDVTIAGRDAVKLYALKEIILAIARGFSPDTARLLLKPDYMLEIINLKDYGLDNRNKMMRVKARVIGTEGKARRVIEELTGASLCIYGKTISIIGECTQVPNAKRAIELLIKGSMHSTVYKWLEDQRRKARREERMF
ncbi:MAG TPA: KH domain-containing protein [Candidatus Nanoarchaeia archaeon]|nr:KH domain-containing protein [Candidatus Nanoarchaeia archaeon]